MLFINFNKGEKKMRFLLISALMLSITTFAQEENSREFADGVIELTTVKVKDLY